jgi:hypothetical protein
MNPSRRRHLDRVHFRKTNPIRGHRRRGHRQIFVRRLGIVGGHDWGRVVAAQETSAAPPSPRVGRDPWAAVLPVPRVGADAEDPRFARAPAYGEDRGVESLISGCRALAAGQHPMPGPGEVRLLRWMSRQQLKSHPHMLGQARGHRKGERRAPGRSKPRRHYADQSAETINCAMPYPPRMTAAKLPATTARRKAAVMAYSMGSPPGKERPSRVRSLAVK